ncbi:MAG: response regulator transcription factor, partial [Candidatus Eremiobacteraeota bacterium]|nr:response regulator transcription factor [Candidatus Eremiobacteraeota bacterium]
RDFDLILLDLMLPGMDGVEVCRNLRRVGRQMPVMMVTARDQVEDKIKGLDAGADDYIVKPFNLQELLARVRALLRRSETNESSSPNPDLRVGQLVLNKSRQEAQLDGTSIPLSTTESSLLEYLMSRAGETVPREALLEHVWQYDFNGDHNVLHVYISYLRSKLEGPGRPKWIHTVRGVGYRLQAPT